VRASVRASVPIGLCNEVQL